MEKTHRPIPWLSGGLAVLIGLLFVAVAVPCYAPHPVPYARLLAIGFVPALCIFTLGRRWIVFDWLAWIFLSVLLATVFMS